MQSCRARLPNACTAYAIAEGIASAATVTPASRSCCAVRGRYRETSLETGTALVSSGSGCAA
jgi:hypothetical protein